MFKHIYISTNAQKPPTYLSVKVIAEGMLAPGEHVVVDAAHREHVHHAGRALVAYKEGVLSLVNWHELSEHYSAASFYTASLYSTQAKNQMKNDNT